MTAAELLARNPRPTEQQVRDVPFRPDLPPWDPQCGR